MCNEIFILFLLICCKCRFPKPDSSSSFASASTASSFFCFLIFALLIISRSHICTCPANSRQCGKEWWQAVFFLPWESFRDGADPHDSVQNWQDLSGEITHTCFLHAGTFTVLNRNLFYLLFTRQKRKHYHYLFNFMFHYPEPSVVNRIVLWVVCLCVYYDISSQSLFIPLQMCY